MVSALSGDGPVAELEASVAGFLGAKHALGVSSGTGALITALVACGVRAGSEVILPAYSWGQTLGAVLHCGATPMFADIDPERLTLDVDQTAQRITDRTAAIVAVHMYGCPADLWALRELADRSGVALVEDAAQAFGSTIGGRHAGTIGDVGCFSLGRGKPLTGGEGGLVVTNRDDVFERAVAFSQHPLRQRRDLGDAFDSLTSDLGLNFRLHPLAAVIARAELHDFPRRLALRQHAALELGRALHGVPGVLPAWVSAEVTGTIWRFPLTWKPEEVPQARGLRERYLTELFRLGVPVGPDPVGVPLHLRRDAIRHRGSCPVSERRCAQTGLVLASTALDDPLAGERIANAFAAAAVALS